MEIFNIDMINYQSDLSILPVFLSFEITEGIVFLSYDEQTPLAEGIPLFDCITLQDGEGNPVTLPDDNHIYEGHLVFTHTDSTDTDRWHGNAELHWNECLCGLRSGESAHDFGDADSCATCQSHKPIRVEGDGKTLYFTDLNEAIEAAAEMAEAKITLLADASFHGEYEPREGNVTLDLAGFELYIEEINLYGGTWRVIDSSEGQEGLLRLGADSDVYGGLLRLESGNFYIEIAVENDTSASSIEVAGGNALLLYVSVDVGGTLHVTGGAVKRLIVDMYGGRLAIEGGSFEAFSVIYGEPRSSFAITGGSFKTVEFHNVAADPFDLGSVFATADCLRYVD